VGGPIPLHRYRTFKKSPTQRADRIEALAEQLALPRESHSVPAIAELFGVKVQSVAPLRNGLIRKGMIYSPSHGDTEFTVPLFGEFMLRVMPTAQFRR
jgi:hypothetical protein